MDKQKILTIGLIITIILLIAVIFYAVYEPKNNKEIIDNVNNVNETMENTQINNTNTNTSTTNTITNQVVENETIENKKDEEKYVGEEEKNTDQEATEQINKDEKSIKLAKQKWGENDTSVTYNIEQKENNLYYISVTRDANVLAWYEVNTDTWEISDYN